MNFQTFFEVYSLIYFLLNFEIYESFEMCENLELRLTFCILNIVQVEIGVETRTCNRFIRLPDLASFTLHDACKFIEFSYASQHYNLHTYSQLFGSRINTNTQKQKALIIKYTWYGGRRGWWLTRSDQNMKKVLETKVFGLARFSPN